MSEKGVKNKVTLFSWVSFIVMERVAIVASFDDSLFRHINVYQPFVDAQMVDKVKNLTHLSTNLLHNSLWINGQSLRRKGSIGLNVIMEKI